MEHSGNLFTSTAEAALWPASGYGVVLLFNSGSPMMLDQIAIVHGVFDIIEGTAPPASGPRLAARIDTALAVLTLVTLALGVSGVVRAGRRPIGASGADDLVAGFLDCLGHVDLRYGLVGLDGQPTGLDVDLNSGDAWDLGHLSGDQASAVVARHATDAVVGACHFDLLVWYPLWVPVQDIP